MAAVERHPNQIRHERNLRILHGVFYHGVYYENGVAQQIKEKEEQEKPEVEEAVVFFPEEEEGR